MHDILLDELLRPGSGGRGSLHLLASLAQADLPSISTICASEA